MSIMHMYEPFIKLCACFPRPLFPVNWEKKIVVCRQKCRTEIIKCIYICHIEHVACSTTGCWITMKMCLKMELLKYKTWNQIANERKKMSKICAQTGANVHLHADSPHTHLLNTVDLRDLIVLKRGFWKLLQTPKSQIFQFVNGKNERKKNRLVFLSS